MCMCCHSYITSICFLCKGRLSREFPTPSPPLGPSPPAAAIKPLPTETSNLPSNHHHHPHLSQPTSNSGVKLEESCDVDVEQCSDNEEASSNRTPSNRYSHWSNYHHRLSVYPNDESKRVKIEIYWKIDRTFVLQQRGVVRRQERRKWVRVRAAGLWGQEKEGKGKD